MGAEPPKVAPRPPRAIEFLAGIVLPPACRESVLGDLHERYTSPAQYIRDAISVVPWVIASRIARTTDPRLLLLEAFALYLAFATSARLAAGPKFLDQWNAYLRLALPVVAALAATVLVDAYASAEKRLFYGPASIFGALWLQFVSTAATSDWGLPSQVRLYGSVLGVLLVAALRALFLPGDHRTTGAG
jgi:hypothetical protein